MVIPLNKMTRLYAFPILALPTSFDVYDFTIKVGKIKISMLNFLSLHDI